MSPLSRLEILVAILHLLLVMSGAAASPRIEHVPGLGYFAYLVPLEGPTSLTIENARGAVRIVEGDGDRIRMIAENKTEHPALIHVEGPRTHRKIWIEYPEKEQEPGFVASTKVTQPTLGGTTESTVSFGVTLAKAALIHLRLEVPGHLLKNLDVSAPENDVEVIGQFVNGDQTPARYVKLHSEAGSIVCRGMCARRELWIESRDGARLEASHVIGGDIYLGTARADVDFSESLGTYTIDNERGVTKVTKVIGDGEVTGDRRLIKIHDSEGNLFVTNGSGPVDVKDQFRGGITVRTDSGSQIMRNPRALFEDLQSHSGNIRRSRWSARNGKPAPKPAVLDACVTELVRLVTEGW